MYGRFRNNAKCEQVINRYVFMRYRIEIKSTVTVLLIINVIIFFITRVLNIPMPQGFLESLVEKGKTVVALAAQRYGLFLTIFSLFPALIKELGWVWQVFTYMFLHGSLLHLFFNMYALFLFGRPLEERWGNGEFLLFYFFTGVGAGLVTFLWNMMRSPFIPTIGASGAIFGLILAFGIEFPETVLLLFFVIPIRARYAALIFGAIELVMILTGAMSGIGHFTHLAGLLFGYIYYLARIKPRYKRGYTSSIGKLKQVFSRAAGPKFPKQELSGVSRERAIEKAKEVKQKIQRAEVLSQSDRTFLSRLKEAYYSSTAELCNLEEFNADTPVCKDCDSLYACLYRFIMKA